MKQLEDETQVYQDKDIILDESGQHVMILPEGIVIMSTEDIEQRTGENIKTPHYFPNYISSETSQSLVNISDIIIKIDFLSSEIQKLKEENQDLKQEISRIFKDSEINEVKDLPDKKIRKIILKFLNQHKDKEVYPSDIAFEYNLDTKRVFEISQKLKEEGKLI